MLKMKKLIAFFTVAAFVIASIGAGPTTTAVNSPASVLSNLTARAVDLHTATGDVATIAIPSYVTAYQVTSIKITNCSTTPVLASLGLFTGANASGTTVMTSATITGATAATVVLSGTVASSARLTAANLFFNLSVANVAALTCDLKVNIDDLS
jgi:uncharacterized protein YjbI with pentapeptide repeats